MVDRKLISIWEVPKYMIDGWDYLGLSDELGYAWIERITLIKGASND